VSTPVIGQTPLFRPGARLAAGFCLDLARLVVEMLDEDLAPTLVVLGVLSANVAAFDRAAAEQVGQASPWAMIDREPVSAYRLARNLAMPYETARRHVARLVDKGKLVRVGSGVMIAPAVLVRPSAPVAAEAVWRRAVRLCDDLEALGLQVPAHGGEAEPDEQRRVARLANEFLLASIKATVEATHTDMVTTLVFLSIYRANRAALENDPALALAYGGPEQLVADVERAPVSIYALSRRMRLPYETVRRHAAILVDEALCLRTDDGLMVPASVLQSPPIAAGSAQIWVLAADFITAAFGPAPT
jgi:hypothetical protein